MTRGEMAILLRAVAEELDRLPEQPPEGKPPITARVYEVRRGQRGRCPSWVLKQTGLATKQDVLREYGDGFKIVEVLS